MSQKNNNHITAEEAARQCGDTLMVYTVKSLHSQSHLRKYLRHPEIINGLLVGEYSPLSLHQRLHNMWLAESK